MSAQPRAARDLGLIALAGAAFAISSPLAKSVGSIPPLVIACGRCAVAALAIVALRPRQCLAALRALSPKHRAAVPLAGLLLAAHFGLFLAGLATTSLPAAVALVSLEPLAVVLAAWIAFGLRPTRGEAAGVLVASAGAMVVASAAGSGEHRALGDALVLGAVAVYGAYVAAARGLHDSMPVFPYAAAVYGAAALWLAPLAVATRPWRGTLAEWSAVVALGLVPTLIGHTVVQGVARRVSPSLVALVSPGETVGALVIGAALMGAWPSAREGAGTALVLAGALVAIRYARGG